MTTQQLSRAADQTCWTYAEYVANGRLTDDETTFDMFCRHNDDGFTISLPITGEGPSRADSVVVYEGWRFDDAFLPDAWEIIQSRAATL